MTVSVDKKIIHIGWEAAISVVIFLIVSVYGFSAFTTKFLEKQDDIYRATLRQQRRDSMQAVMNDTLSKSIYFIKQDISTIRRRVESLENIREHGYRNYTERKVEGKLQYSRADK